MKIIDECLICNSSQFQTLTSTHCQFFNISFPILKCYGCDLIFSGNIPSDEEHNKYYEKYDENISKQWIIGEKKYNSIVAQQIKYLKPNGRLLDVGCGYGLFLNEMKNIGFEVTGVEQVAGVVEYNKNNYNHNIINSSVENYFSECNTKYDIITYLNVLEHVRNPKYLLELTKDKLENNGLLVINVPNAYLQVFIGRLRKLLGFSTNPYLINEGKFGMIALGAPHHLYSFTPKTIEKLIKLTGFELLFIQPAPIAENVGNSFRNALKYIMTLFSKVVYYGSLKKVNFGYTMMVYCKKVSN